MDLGSIGVWCPGLGFGDMAAADEGAAALEAMGYSTLWVPGGISKGEPGSDVFSRIDRLLAVTSSLRLATGIVSVWVYEPHELAEAHAAVTKAHPGRFMLGLGISHSKFVPGYERPIDVMRTFMDGLDAVASPVPKSERMIAALGPRMLDLARERSAGTHPYIVTPEHSAVARARLGADAHVAPEQGVVLSTDASAARSIAREDLALYLQLPNYVNNWRRLGFDDDDFRDGGSNRFIDAVVAWGTPEQIGARVREHLGAGANHVCVRVLGHAMSTIPIDDLAALAGPLGLTGRPVGAGS